MLFEQKLFQRLALLSDAVIITLIAGAACESRPPSGPSTGGPYPHEPPGFLLITSQPWSAIPTYGAADANADYWHDNFSPDPNMSIGSDPAAPKSPPNVGDLHVPPGQSNGNSQNNIERNFTDAPGGQNYTSIYITWWIRHSPNWVPHPIGSKIYFFQMAPSAYGYSAIYFGEEASHMVFEIVNQGPGGGVNNWYAQANVGDSSAWYENASTGSWLGQWYRVEVLLRMNTATNADGVVKVWIWKPGATSGTLVIDRADALWVPNAGDPHLWSGIRWNHVYGGGGGSSGDQHEYMDHVYVSGGN